METEIVAAVVQALNYSKDQVQASLKLLNDGKTVPFIARYRKEATGSLDEVALREIQTTYHRLEKLNHRKQEVIRKISEQGKLTAALTKKIQDAKTVQEIEDLYLPYKQKRRTKAQIAREHGLMPLAQAITQFKTEQELITLSQSLLSAQVKTSTEAFLGAHEILTEAFSEDARLRAWVRHKLEVGGKLQTKVKAKAEKKDEKGIYQDYYEYEQPISKLASHQVLAIDRGERQDILNVKLILDEAMVLAYLEKRFLAQKNLDLRASQEIQAAYTDAYKRFVKPAIEREVRKNLSQQAAEAAIAVFGENLYHLLMQAPLKGKVILGLDPGFRTGCKLAVVDATGKFLAKEVIYPHEKAVGQEVNPHLRKQAQQVLTTLIEQYQVEMIAIGNGTASRESEQFVAETIAKLSRPVYYAIVSEAGASVYSASANARAEFPDLNVEERSAISIARRLQDPLAELIKIDPKSLGVGQYQHDLPEKQLDEQLEAVIETGVNQVGVNLNTASSELLRHISGLNKTIAQNIVTYRNEVGKFQSRLELKKVARLGPRAFEQSAGFLRVVAGKNPFDNTDIHPESYDLAQKLLTKLQLKQTDLGTTAIKQALSKIDLIKLAQEFGAGYETLKDITLSLEKPGRDFREKMPAPLLRKDVLKIEDLKPGMKLEGTVRNVVAFGAFVDIGVKQDGLVHISRMSEKFVKQPSELVAVGDIVTVWIEDVDLKRGRIQLSFLPVNVDE